MHILYKYMVARNNAFELNLYSRHSVLTGLAHAQRAQRCDELDVVFVVDASGSIQDQPDGSRDPGNWNQLLDFVAKVIDDLSKRVRNARFAEVVFSDRVETVFTLTTNDQSLAAQVRQTPYLGDRTNIADGLSRSIEILDPSRGAGKVDSNVIILITDGKANLNEARTQSEAARARSRAEVFVVGITDAIDEAELNGIAGGNRRRRIQVTDFASLESQIETLVTSVCPTQPTPSKSCVQSSYVFGY